MINVEIGDSEYKLPTGWHEVSLRKFAKIQRLSSILNEYKSKQQFALEMTSILLGDAPLKDLMRLDRESYEILSNKCAWVNEDVKASNKDKFEINGELYLPLKDLNKMSMGDSISMELIISESDEVDVLGNMMPILIRKAKKVMRNGEEVEVPGDFDSDNYAETKELFLDNLMVSDVINFQNFFLGGAKQSSIITKATSENPKRKTKMKKKENQEDQTPQ